MDENFLQRVRKFPCDEILTRPNATIPDKAWLRWKKKNRQK